MTVLDQDVIAAAVLTSSLCQLKLGLSTEARYYQLDYGRSKSKFYNYTGCSKLATFMHG